ncbi:MAG: hypothetical protein ACE5J3_11335 [Methanosarcinales archaeon]
MPKPPEKIEEQMLIEIGNFREEVGVPLGNVAYGTGDENNPTLLDDLLLKGDWKNQSKVSISRAGYLASQYKKQKLRKRPRR